MIRLLETTSFLALAAGLHFALFAYEPEKEGVSASGSGGAAQVSLQAADQRVTDLVRDWNRPPDAAQEPDTAEMNAPEPPEMDMARIAPSTPQDTPPAPNAPTGMALPRMAARAPAIDRTVTAPPPQPEPEPAQEAPQEVADPAPEPPEVSLRPEPRPKRQAPPPPPREASPGQKAQGAGGGAHAGATDRQQASTLSQSQRQSLTAQWGAAVRTSVERRKRYPGAARGASGTVTVRLTIGRDGTLRAVAVTRSSGVAALDDAARRAVRAARFPGAPAGLGKPSYTFTLSMKFSS